MKEGDLYVGENDELFLIVELNPNCEDANLIADGFYNHSIDKNHRQFSISLGNKVHISKIYCADSDHRKYVTNILDAIREAGLWS